MTTSTQSEDEVKLNGSGESTTDSDESQNGGVEDNSHSEARKNQSNFKKLSIAKKNSDAKALKLATENALLKKQLWIAEDSDEWEEGSGDEEEIDTAGEVFTDPSSEIWFMKNPGAEDYREKMALLIEENPFYWKLSKSELFVLAKDKFPKSESRKSFDLGKGKSSAKGKSPSDYTPEEIEAMPLAEYKATFMPKKK